MRWLLALAQWVRTALSGREPDVAGFLHHHPHMHREEALRVLTFVHNHLTHRGCPRTVAAVARAIRDHFPGWFVFYEDAARHAAEALGYDLVDSPTE